MQTFEDGDEVELMSTIDRGSRLESIARGTHGKVLGPEHGLGNFSGSGYALIHFSDIGAYTVPEKWLTIIKKARKDTGGVR